MNYKLQYSQFVDIYKITPSLKSLTNKQHLPQNWPLLFEGTVKTDKEVISFWVSDLNTKAICISSNKELMNKISKFEPGQIIFLTDSVIVKHSKVLGLEIEVFSIQTIKEFIDKTEEHSTTITLKNNYDNTKPDDIRCITLAQRLELQNKAYINESKK